MAKQAKKTKEIIEKPAKAAIVEEPKVNPDGTPMVDAEELEEQEDAAAAAKTSADGNAAALAAASGNVEMSASFKNFRHHPDMENFYRFIFDNDLRVEALQIVDEILVEKKNRRQVKAVKLQAH